ncbi:MAG TPA: dTDP-4-dehydrorhamnose reductase [Sphingomonadaceae bacterium]|nr:dTDP-4-dehydrorhamnose reductase [Sphingomonadaceae bacterium]
MPSPTILVTGKSGQVGHALLPVLARLGTVFALGRAQCDLADPAAITRTVRDIRPDIIVNPAAYTAVDKAEGDRDRAFAINALAPAILAEAAKDVGAAMIHYSTDYVFDGRKTDPYLEDDETHPLSVYGTSKRDGERALRATLREHVILRTSWVFSPAGANFLKTMIRLAAEREELAVVVDQVGAPTSADLLAQVTGKIVQAILGKRQTAAYGTYHLAAAGQTSWHGYAVFAIEEARAAGLPVRVTKDAIRPIPASAFPTPAARPANSRLDTAKLRGIFGIDLPPWQDGVRLAVEALARS